MSIDMQSADRWIPGLISIEKQGTRTGEAVPGPDEAVAILRQGGLEPSIPDAGELAETFETDVADVERVAALVDVVKVEAPLRAARVLAEHGTAASPIHWLAYQWHIFSSRLPPEPAGKVKFRELDPPRRKRVIAVVDSGLAPAAVLPKWLSSGVRADPVDEESLATDDLASHGTFVAGLIRQSAPRHTISMARAGGLRQPQRKVEDDPHRLAPDPTTEWHVSIALLRLVDRHAGKDRVEALNLSLGVAAADPSSVLGLVMLRKALDAFRTAFPKCEIFASAGNSNGTPPNYPAAFPDVRGVAAAADGGGQVVWTEDTPPRETPADPRSWVTDVAPGCAIAGISGKTLGDAVRWSGSSFASALAAARFVEDGPVAVRDGVAYWPNETVDYARLPGLV